MPTLLSFALPLAAGYAQEQEAAGLREGIPLTVAQCEDARKTGVQHPEKVRAVKVKKIPVPTNPVLAKANEFTGIIGPDSTRLNYGYAIFLREDVWEDRASWVHELAHVAQSERLGGIEAFLKAYLRECLTIGHAKSPLELEAVEAVRKICG